MRKETKTIWFFLIGFLLSYCFIPSLWALTLDETIALAKKNYPPLKEQKYLKSSKQFSYKASFDPYFPTISSNFSFQRTFESSLNSIGRLWDNQYVLDLSINYRLFDAGYRRSQKEQALFSFKQAQADIKTVENELAFTVKKAFYNVLAKEKILQIRQEAEQIAKKNYELALARRKAGVAMLSDVTQAQVRYTNARMQTVAAKKDLEKATAELNSLIGWPLDKKTKLNGTLRSNWIDVSFPMLKDLALKRRPEIERQVLENKKIEESIKGYKSAYFPKLDTRLNYSRYDNEINLTERETVFLVSLSYDIFNGLGRYYKVSAQKKVLKATQARLAELKRQICLEVYQAYKDLQLAFSNLQIASELVKEAKINYEQAYGEYKVGKGDILSLIQAEANWAESKTVLTQEILNYNIAISALEKAVFANLF
ncbi:MAG: TolC family protein [Candidatus Desulfofervidaceae bacterium]|nr:TolC family protein [Candidatus Desulfofervidaceae bacterium]